MERRDIEDRIANETTRKCKREFVRRVNGRKRMAWWPAPFLQRMRDLQRVKRGIKTEGGPASHTNGDEASDRWAGRTYLPPVSPPLT